jgi:hypothetical protein
MQVTLKKLRKNGFVCRHHRRRFSLLFQRSCKLNEDNCKLYLTGRISWPSIVTWLYHNESWNIDRKLAKYLGCRVSQLSSRLKTLEVSRRPKALCQILYRMLEEDE